MSKKPRPFAHVVEIIPGLSVRCQYPYALVKVGVTLYTISQKGEVMQNGEGFIKDFQHREAIKMACAEVVKSGRWDGGHII